MSNNPNAKKPTNRIIPVQAKKIAELLGVTENTDINPEELKKQVNREKGTLEVGVKYQHANSSWHSGVAFKKLKSYPNKTLACDYFIPEITNSKEPIVIFNMDYKTGLQRWFDADSFGRWYLRNISKKYGTAKYQTMTLSQALLSASALGHKNEIYLTLLKMSRINSGSLVNLSRSIPEKDLSSIIKEINNKLNLSFTDTMNIRAKYMKLLNIPDNVNANNIVNYSQLYLKDLIDKGLANSNLSEAYNSISLLSRKYINGQKKILDLKQARTAQRISKVSRKRIINVKEYIR